MTSPRTNVSFVLIPRFNMLTLTTMIEPMRIANYLAPQQLYQWDFRSPEPGRLTASNRLQVDCLPLETPAGPKPHLVILCGSWGTDHYHNRALFNWLRRRERIGTRLIGVELGVYALARAGLLAGRRATTHWSCKAGFAEAFPNIDVCEQLYTIDQNIMTCAGGTAGLDLMLSLLAAQHGEQLASEVSNQILHGPRRPAERAQKFAAGGVDDQVHPDVRAAMSKLESRIEEPLRVPALCRELGVSQRHLERLFRRDTGCTIVQFSKLLRLQYARVLLTSTDLSIREVSASCGFESMSYFSLCFLKTFGKKPSRYRQAWPENEPVPSWPGTVYAFLQGSIARRTPLRRRPDGGPRPRP